ncbi:MAG TPA: hypothetical protein DCE47_08275 [Planctomycetaceae bacterium]|nr:hypothetical protein [Planctomycetaceae bacterium]HCD01910.1 hypothetical protein [Planctomycetaceae bacterium]
MHRPVTSWRSPSSWPERSTGPTTTPSACEIPRSPAGIPAGVSTRAGCTARHSRR